MNNRIEDEYKFSVLMSVYDKEKVEYFKEALDSILLRQTLKPNEFILVVDGPVNEGLNKLINDYEKEYKDIFKIYRLEKNSSLGKALNYGLEKCKYELIARADSDDINDKSRFEKQIKCFKENPNLDVLGTFIDEFIDDYNEPIDNKKMPISHEEIYKMSKIRNPINHATVMFKKDTIIKNGSYKHLPYVEDYYMWVRVLLNGGLFKNIDEYLVHVRVGNGMFKRRSNRQHIDSWKTLSTYMIDNNMINKIEYFRNILSIYIFIYLPIYLKKIVYKIFLRN